MVVCCCVNRDDKVNMTQHNVTTMNDSDSEDGEISVGCPSPLNVVNSIPEDDDKFEESKEEEDESETVKPRKRSCSDDGASKEGCDEYFKPLKKLKMMNLSKKRKEEGKERSCSPNSIPLAKQYPIHKGHLPTTSRLDADEEMASVMSANHFPNLNLVPPAHLGIPISIPIALRHFPSPGVLIDGRNMFMDNRNLVEQRQLLERNLLLENRHLFERNLVENRLADHQRFLLNADPRHLLTAADTRHLLTPEQRNLLGIENRLFEKSLLDHRQLLEARMLETRLAEGRISMLENRDRDGEKLEDLTNPAGQNGVKSFSILDILNHRPKGKEETKTESGSKIVRPWDSKGSESGGKRTRPKSADFCYSETLSTCSSDRSSTAGSLGGSGSDCCTSPDIINCSVSGGTSGGTSSRQQQQRVGGKTVQGKNTSPLDALFQMTNKTFDGMNGETSGGKLSLLLLFFFSLRK